MTTKLESQGPTLILTIFLGALAAIAPLSTDMYLPSLPEIMDIFGASTSLVQLTITASIAGMAFGQVIAGPMSDDKGRKVPLFIGMALFMLSSLACIFAPTMELFIAFRFIQGFMGGTGIVIARAVARDICKGSALTKFFSLLMMINGLAPILAPVIGGQILRFADWRAIFVTLFAIGLVLTVGALVMKETLPKEKRIAGGMGPILQSFAALLKDKYFMGHCIMQCFSFAAFFAYISGASFVFQNMFHVSPQTFSYIFGANGIALMITGILVGRITGRIPDWKILRFSLLQALIGSLALFAAFWFDLSIAFVIVFLMVTISTIASIGTSSFSMAMQAQGKVAGGASALIGFFSMISGAVMAPIVGIAGDQTAIPMAIIMVLGELGAFLCYYFYIRPYHLPK